MCGRFALHSSKARLEQLLEIEPEPGLGDEIPLSYNIPPTTLVPGARLQNGERRLDLYRWGLVPPWAKDLSFGNHTINARAESVATKPSFCSAFRTKRLLMVGDAFYEWDRSDPKRKRPHLFKRTDGNPMVFAGLWEAYRHPEGHWIKTCSMITRHANADMPVHDRMPVILEPDTWERWLDPHLRDRDELEAMLLAGPDGTLAHYPVDQRVGNVRNDDPSLLEPSEVIEQQTLLGETSS